MHNQAIKPSNSFIGRGIITTICRTKGDFLLHYYGEQISGAEGEAREGRGSSGFRLFYSWKKKQLW